MLAFYRTMQQQRTTDIVTPIDLTIQYRLDGNLTSKQGTAFLPLLERAATLAPHNTTIRWSAGRAALATGDTETAFHWLAPVLHPKNGILNPLLLQDTLTAINAQYPDEPEQVVQIYEQQRGANTPLLTTVSRDIIALAYLKTSTSTDTLRKVREVQPGNLYATYHLWQQSRTSGKESQEYRDTLRHIPLEALLPSQGGLLPYLCETIPHIYRSNIWNIRETAVIADFLVWQYPHASAVEQMLSHLQETYPDQPVWTYISGELYHRRGNLQQAQTMYLRTIEHHPDYQPAYLKLGLTFEQQAQAQEGNISGLLESAATSYVHYLEQQGENDSLVLKHLADVCMALERQTISTEACSDAARIFLAQPVFATSPPPEQSPSTTLHTLATNRVQHTVATLLEQDVATVYLGTDLLQNMPLKNWNMSQEYGWRWVIKTHTHPYSRAVFTLGHEETFTYSSPRSLRLDGLWVSPGSKGKWRAVEYLLPREPVVLDTAAEQRLYAVSFHYRTNRAQKNAKMAFKLTSNCCRLPRTDREWHQVVIVFDPDNEQKRFFQPSIVWQYQGAVEIDNLALYPVTTDRTLPRLDAPLVWAGGTNLQGLETVR